MADGLGIPVAGKAWACAISCFHAAMLPPFAAYGCKETLFPGMYQPWYVPTSSRFGPCSSHIHAPLGEFIRAAESSGWPAGPLTSSTGCETWGDVFTKWRAIPTDADITNRYTRFLIISATGLVVLPTTFASIPPPKLQSDPTPRRLYFRGLG